MAQTQTQTTPQTQIEKLDTELYRELGEGFARLLLRYGEREYSAKVIELDETTLRAYVKWNRSDVPRGVPTQGEIVILTVRLRPSAARKIRKLIISARSTLDFAHLWNALERAVIYMSPRGADLQCPWLEMHRRRRRVLEVLNRLKGLIPKP